MLTIDGSGKCVNGMSMDDPSIIAIDGGGGGGLELAAGGETSDHVGGGGFGLALYSEKIGNLEKSIAAVFNKVAYGSTTTKRSIPDNSFVPSLTTVPTPPLTTLR